jgi:hypothetical protein
MPLKRALIDAFRLAKPVAAVVGARGRLAAENAASPWIAAIHASQDPLR